MPIVDPSLEEVRLLLNDYLSDSNIIRHCEATRQKALRIAKILSAKIQIDFDLVSIGALLHDLGRARTHDVTHGYVGGKLLELYDYPASIVNIVSSITSTKIFIDNNPKGWLIPFEKSSTITTCQIHG